MNIFVGFLLMLSAGGALAKDCPPVPKHYEELGCIPLFHTGDECPYTYDCSAFETRDRSQCYFAGANYKLNQEINNDLIAGSCSIGCRCGRGYGGDKIKFTCAHIDCPEFFGSGRREGEDCIMQYKLNQCCSSRTVCGEEMNKLARCSYNNESYYEGQSIDTGRSSYSCICGKHFDSSKSLAENTESCRKINCMIDLHYGDKFEDGCVPIYYGEEKSCPIPEFRCPDSNTTVVKSLNRAVPDDAGSSAAECKFGNLRMVVGDELSPKSNKCVTCTCKVPPYVTCVQNRDC